MRNYHGTSKGVRVLKAPASSVLFLLALVAFVSLGLPDAVLGVAWPSIRRTFGVPLDRLGLLLLGSTTGYLISSFLSGAIVQRVGVGGMLVGSSLLVVTSAVGYALAPWWALVLLAAVPAGLGAGAIDAGINAYAAARFPPGRVAWLHASWGIGATLGPLLMTSVLALDRSWRWGYGVLALVLTGLGLGFQRTRALWEAGEAAAPAATIGDSLKEPFLRANVVLFFFYTGVEAMAGQWAYTLFTEGRGFSREGAGVSVGAYWASLTLGRIVSGALAHHVSPALLLRASVALVPLFALLVAATRSPWSGFAALGLLGFSGGPVFPLLIAGTPARVGEAHSHNAVGFQVAAACLGSAALPATAGVLARAYGIEAISASLVAAALVAFALHESVLWRERLASPAPPTTLPEVLLSRKTDDQDPRNTEERMKRKASAVWRAGLKDGKGSISTDSGVLSSTQYSFSTRFEDGIGTNPEELIAAAHAGCFSMALSGQMENAGLTVGEIRTTATVTMEKLDAGFTLTAVHLDVAVKSAGADKAKFEQAAQNAKTGCPISRVLNATITMDAKLEG